MTEDAPLEIGLLCRAAGQAFPLQILQSRAGYYLGTLNLDGEPFTRESVQYWPSAEAATIARAKGLWTQRLHL